MPGALAQYAQRNYLSRQGATIMAAGNELVNVGHAWKPPFCWEAYVNWDEGTWNPNWALCPALWTQPIEMLTGQLSGPDRFVEWDVFEADATHRTFGIWDIDCEVAVSQTPLQISNGFAMTAGAFHRLGGIWLRPEDTGTAYGLIIGFQDGNFSGDEAYSPTLGSQPGGLLLFGASDNHHFPIMINPAENVTSNPGGGMTLLVDWVKAYGKAHA